MLLVSVAELVNVDQGEVAGYLTISVRAPLCRSSLETVIADLDPRSTCYRHLWRSFVPRAYLLWIPWRNEYRACRDHTGAMSALLSFCFVLKVLFRDKV